MSRDADCRVDERFVRYGVDPLAIPGFPFLDGELRPLGLSDEEKQALLAAPVSTSMFAVERVGEIGVVALSDILAATRSDSHNPRVLGSGNGR